MPPSHVPRPLERVDEEHLDRLDSVGASVITLGAGMTGRSLFLGETLTAVDALNQGGTRGHLDPRIMIFVSKVVLFRHFSPKNTIFRGFRLELHYI